MTGNVLFGQGVDLVNISKNFGVLLGSDPSGHAPEQSGLDWSSHTALILLEVGVLPSAQEHRDLSKVCAAEQELYFLNFWNLSVSITTFISVVGISVFCVSVVGASVIPVSVIAVSVVESSLQAWSQLACDPS